ncbi:MAG: NADH:ubiquinone oxidoreductase subunit NDUFA12, partial [Pseudomonadota bacterium]
MAQSFSRRFLQIFTWWHGTTWGTSFTTWLRGEAVGKDEYGNQYYRSRKGKVDPALGVERRWVIYNGVADPTTIPPGWYRWMHHLGDTPQTENSYVAKHWEKPQEPNHSGSAAAHRHQGSFLRP